MLSNCKFTPKNKDKEKKEPQQLTKQFTGSGSLVQRLHLLFLVIVQLNKCLFIPRILWNMLHSNHISLLSFVQ